MSGPPSGSGTIRSALSIFGSAPPLRRFCSARPLSIQSPAPGRERNQDISSSACPQGAPRTAAGWPVTPEALYWGPRFLYERYRTPILITENGMSCHDAVSLDGQVHDPNRIDYLSRYLAAYRRAARDGVNAAGYFAWSLMDNFEWSLGYTQRFGLVYVDYQTLRRIPKDSARWYAETNRSNGEHVGRVEPVSEENG